MSDIIKKVVEKWANNGNLPLVMEPSEFKELINNLKIEIIKSIEGIRNPVSSKDWGVRSQMENEIIKILGLESLS